MKTVLWTQGHLISVIVVSLSLGAVGTTLAQDVSIGVRGGLNTAHAFFENELDSEREARQGFLAGGTLSYRLNSWSALQIDAVYQRKGWTGARGEGGRRSGFFEVPVLFRLQRSTGLLPHLVVGPVISYEVSCKYTDIPGMRDVDCDDPSISLERPSTDVGILMGFGIGRRVSSGTLALDAYVSVGLRDIDHEPLPRGAQRYCALSISVAYTVGLGGEKGGIR